MSESINHIFKWLASLISTFWYHAYKLSFPTGSSDIYILSFLKKKVGKEKERGDGSHSINTTMSFLFFRLWNIACLMSDKELLPGKSLKKLVAEYREGKWSSNPFLTSYLAPTTAIGQIMNANTKRGMAIFLSFIHELSTHLKAQCCEFGPF